MIRCRILGPTSLSGPDGSPLDDVVSQPRRLALLAYLAVQSARGFIRRDALLPVFWPELDQERARGALRQALYVLRSALGDGVVVSRGAEEVGIAPGTLWCDAVEFEAACDTGQWSAALDLYRGDCLESFFIAEAPEFEQWMQARQGRLRLRAAEAARALAASQESTGALGDAIATLRRALSFNSTDEESLRHLLSLLDAQGDRAAAAHEYDAFVARLAERLGASPSAETRAVFDRIRQREHVRNAEVATPRPVPPAPAPATPAGIGGELPQRRRTPRMVWAIGLVTVVIAVVLLARAPWSRLPAADVPERLVVLPFDVRGDADAAYLREAIVDLLSMDLDGAGGMRTIDPNAMRAAAGSTEQPTAEAGRSIAGQFGARYFVMGRVIAAGPRLRVQSMLYDVRSADSPVAQASREGSSESVFEIVDGIAADLLVASQHTGDARLSRSAALTTRSLPALKAYLEGDQAFQRGDRARAADALRRAVAIDSTFALASYRLSLVIDDANGSSLETIEAANRAVRHSRRLSERDRLLLEAHMANLSDDVVGAEERYRAILARYPDEVDAWYRLAEVIFHQTPVTGRPPMEAREPFERLLQLAPMHLPALQHLARIAALERRDRELDSLYRRTIALNLAPAEAAEAHALWVFTVGSTAEQERFIAERAASRLYLATASWATAVFARNLDAMRRMSAATAGPSRTPVERASSRRTMARLHAIHGRMDSSAAQLRELEAIDPDQALEDRAFFAIMPFRQVLPDSLGALRAHVAAWPAPVSEPETMTNNSINGPWRRHIRSYLLGHLDALLGDTASARIQADSIERIPVPALPDAAVFARELATSVRAHSLWRRGQSAAALRLVDGVRRARPFPYRGSAPRTQDRYVRAELLFEAGRFDEALRWYGSFEYTGMAQLVFASPAYLRQAQIQERLGKPDLAAAHYRQFVDIWKGADAVYRPSVRLAEERLRELSDARGRR